MSDQQVIHTCTRCRAVLEPIHESMPNQWEFGLELELHGFYGGFFDNLHADNDRDLHKLCHECSHALVRFLKIDDKVFEFGHSNSGHSWCNGYMERVNQ